MTARAARVSPVLVLAFFGLWFIQEGGGISLQAAHVGTVMLLIGSAYGRKASAGE